MNGLLPLLSHAEIGLERYFTSPNRTASTLFFREPSSIPRSSRMRSQRNWSQKLLQASFIAGLPAYVLGGTEILRTEGFTSCLDDSAIRVNALNVEYDRAANQVTFDVGGTSTKVQNVTATLVVNAYGKEVYNSGAFDPCAQGAEIDQLCPGRCQRVTWCQSSF